jgi:hypothetical protein
VDGANTAGDASKSQWKLVPGSSLDQFSLRRSPASETYNEDALFFIAVCGIAYATTGTNYSVYGVTSSPGGRGVFGLASATTRSALAV